jgi:hypothetical protein
MVEVAGASGSGISAAPVLLVCPTRARAGNARRLIDTWGRTGVCSDLIFCVDDDDPQLPAYRALMGERMFHRGVVTWLRGPRMSLCGWTDLVAAEYAPRYQALMSIGDDHVPETGAFDLKLYDAAAIDGGGFAYGDDGVQHENLPTACLITTNILRALAGPDGKPRMCLPGARHMFTDAYWRDLAAAAGCRYYLPHVSVRHLHHITRASVRDQTYLDGEASWAADEAVYRAWLADRIGFDATIVKEVIGQ